MREKLIYIFLIIGWIAKSQEIPPVKNFQPSDYNSGNQNWSIDQDRKNVIYVSNNNGLLVFNSAQWKEFESPNGTIMRSVKTIEDKVYSGYYMEFGFWEKNEFGTLNYISLSDSLDVDLLEDEEFWTIIGIEHWVVFQSLKRIYIYNSQTTEIKIIESDKEIHKMYEVDGAIYFQRLGDGLFIIENGNDRLLVDDPVVKDTEVVNLFSVNSQLIILTRDKGFYKLDRDKLTSWGDFNTKISDFSIYSGILLSNGHFALGTISSGLICLNPENNSLLQIDQGSGLINNTILSLFEDADNNIWLGLDNGISFINFNAPLKVFNENKGTLGSVYTSAIYEGYLYLGTNQGLFYKSLEKDQGFTFISGTEGQVWSLEVLDGTLFCGHHSGTFTINQGNATKINDISGTWNIKKLNESDLLIQGNYDGLYILKKKNGHWQIRNKINGFNYSSRSFEVLGQRIFVNHEYRGVFKLNINEPFTQTEQFSIDSLLKGANSSVTRYRDNILYAYKKGIYKFDTIREEFVKDSLLSKIYSEEQYSSGKIVPNDQNDGFWIFTKENLTLVLSGSLGESPRVKSVPLSLDARGDVIDYENIISLDQTGRYLFGTKTGYLIINLNEFDVNDFQTLIGSVSYSSSDNYWLSENKVNLNNAGVFENDFNNIQVDYYTPEYYQYFTTYYQFKLSGLYEEWSQWTTESSIQFENLPPGDYTFKVRSKIGDKISSNEATYSFKIQKPWYFSNLMIAIYAFILLVLIVIIHSLYRSYYHSKHGQIIEKSKKELELEKLRSEKEIIRIKNEQLQQNYKEKSKELAMSTMSIIHKNEVLNEVKEKLLEVSDKKTVSPVVKVIDRNLNHNENWKYFQEAFETADSEFFKKIKDRHPDLSPSDLKLCAYLRLNLSTKEIAPLFNISPRSVEIKRYRLRKKLELDNNSNLTDYILSI